MRYEDFDDSDINNFDYDSLARDCDDLYSYDEEYDEHDDEEAISHSYWENYYHNLTEEIDE